VAVDGRRPIRATAGIAGGGLSLDVPVEGRARVTFRR
jgi:hypothetical protein